MTERLTFPRNGLPCLLDPCRARLVAATPEEYVRQDTIDWLVNVIGVPKSFIRSEFNQRRRGAKGRADIVVLAPGSTDYDGRALVVVECKAPGTFLDDKTWEQGWRYADALGASYIVLANGTDWQFFDRQGGDWSRATGLLRWADLVVGAPLPPAAPWRFRRWPWRAIATPNAARQTLARHRLEWIVGEDSGDHLVPLAANFFGLLADVETGPTVPFWSGDVYIHADLGRRTRTFHNVAGGSHPSEYYRSFLVYENSRQSYQVVSLTVMSQEKTVNHPHWGNRRGTTTLIVAVDDDPSPHVSLNMVLDDVATPEEFKTGWVPMRHKGSLTDGKRGAVPLRVVLDRVAQAAPDLVSDDRILLGELPTRTELTWPMAQTLVGNLIRYALIRDRIREELRNASGSPPRNQPSTGRRQPVRR